jgi:hypothetical protein
MLKVRYSPSGIDFEGTAEELRNLRSQVLALALATKGQVSIMVETNYDPAPYDSALELVVISVGAGPTGVEVVDGRQLCISASADNLRRMASFIVVPDGAKPGWHSHYEYFAGNEFIMANAEPVTFSLRRLTTA